MAAPRIFVSSTFYDLRHIRNDLERFIREIGYEPVLHERGSIAYGKDEGLEEYAYREVELCDILVSVVGGRFGTAAENEEGSISQVELKTALRLGKQVYVFVQKNVLNEFQTWDLNRDRDVAWATVDDERVFHFLAEIHALPRNNPIHGFETTSDITLFLRLQWAGLFQRFLASAGAADQVKVVDRLGNSVSTLERLVRLLSEHQEARADVVKSILLMQHPAFQGLRQGLGLNFYIRFYTSEELSEVMAGLGFEEFEDEDSEEYHQWKRKRRVRNRQVIQFVMVRRQLFDENGDLKPLQPGAWEADWLQVKSIDEKPDDDLPF